MSVNIPNQALPDAELLEGSRLPGLNWDDFRVFLAVVEIGSIHRAAEAVGRKLKTLSARQQVVCITHLPQIAAFADQHFLIEKSDMIIFVIELCKSPRSSGSFLSIA